MILSPQTLSDPLTWVKIQVLDPTNTEKQKHTPRWIQNDSRLHLLRYLWCCTSFLVCLCVCSDAKFALCLPLCIQVCMHEFGCTGRPACCSRCWLIVVRLVLLIIHPEVWFIFISWNDDSGGSIIFFSEETFMLLLLLCVIAVLRPSIKPPEPHAQNHTNPTIAICVYCCCSFDICSGATAF